MWTLEGLNPCVLKLVDFKLLVLFEAFATVFANIL